MLADGAYGFSPLQTIGSLIINLKRVCLLAALPGECVGNPLLYFYPLSQFYFNLAWCSSSLKVELVYFWYCVDRESVFRLLRYWLID